MRKHICISFQVLAALACLTANAWAQGGGGGRGPGGAPAPPALKVAALSGGAYWTSGGAGGNTGFIVGDTGVIVIDAKQTAASAKEVLDEIAKVTPKPVTHLILTHSDPDHVNGLVAYPKGLTIIAQENCKKEMEDVIAAAAVAAMAPPARAGAGGGRGGPAPFNAALLKDYLPTKTVAKTEDDTIDGVHLRLMSFGPGHTSGDLMVYLPDQKILYTGDILTMQFASPFVHLEKHGTPEGMIANLKGALALNVDTYVPGHGDLQTKAAVQKRLTESEARLADVKKLFAEGKTLHETRLATGDPLPEAGPGFRAPSFTETSYRYTSATQPYNPHDLSGVWDFRGAGGFTINNTPPKMTEWAQARYDVAKPGLGPRGAPLGNDPIMRCNPMGLVRSMVWGVYPTEIIQNPQETLLLFDWFDTRSAIWTDGRKLPEDPEPRFYGYSIGHWEGNDFVVESTGLDERQWLDADAHPITPEGKVVERFRRVDHDTIKWDIKVTDPKAYTQPWEQKDLTANLMTHGLNPEVEMREDICIPSVEAQYKEKIREPAGEKH
jgi:glyoxylase-like metal-dependent hydrolase (beta-lactamase superfamily II)